MTVLSDPRFEVVRELGRGAAAVVLHVRDRVHGVDRALKLATEKGQVRRFRREYFRLCELRHPNIVSAFDFGLTPAGLPFYTMELVDGVHLGAVAGGSDPELLAALVLQALEALGVLHARGLVHRDLKPRNLLVVGEGPRALVRLIDLGLAAPVGSRGGAAGTLPYMAPEVARGEEVDGRADLYSLGAVLYETLLPGEAARTLEQVAERLTQAPPAPSHLDPLVPASLSAFVMRLLSPDPRARFADAEEAAAALAVSSELALRRDVPRAIAERLVHAGAVSHRNNVVAKVQRAAQDVVATRRGQAWCFEAAAGLGKSPLLRELAMALNLLGLRVMQWSASSEAASPVADLLRGAAALAPELAGELRWPEPGEPPGELSGIVDGLGARLAEGLGRVPTAVLLDDVHRAEPAALDVLAALARAAPGWPVLLLVATEPPREGPGVAAALEGQAQQVRLRPLTELEVARLAAHRLHGLHLPAPALERLVQDSQGMPILVERTLARLIVDHTVQRQGRVWVFVGGRYRPARHGDPALVAQRLAEMAPATREVLWAAAVLETDLDAVRLAAISGLEREAVGEALLELERLDFLDPLGAGAEPRYEFGSRSTAGAVQALIPAPRCAALHDAAAALLAQERGGDPRGEAEIEHLLRGTDDGLAIAAAQESAERAAAVFADRRAIEYLLRARGRVRDPLDPRASRMALRLGKLHERVGELEQAAVWYEVAASSPVEGDPGCGIEAALGLAGVCLLRGMVNAAEARAQEAVELSRRSSSSAPHLLAMAERLQAHVAAERGEPERAAGLLREALATFEAAGAEAPALEVLLELARFSRGQGELVQAVRYARRALQRARRVGNAAAIAEASVVLGRGLVRGGRFPTARRVLMGGLRIARGSGDRLREAQLLRQLGNVLLRSGELELAVERYTHALELARATRARAEEVAALRAIGVVRSRFGEHRPALIALHASFELASAVGALHGAGHAALELAHTYGRLGDYSTARRFLDSTTAIGAQLGDPLLETSGAALRAWVDVKSGDPTAAQSIVPFVLARIAAIEDPGNRAQALVYAGRSALLLGWTQTARRVAHRLAAEIETSRRTDYVAISQAVLGRAALDLGEHARADELLGAAAAAAAKTKQRPLEVEVRTALGMLHRGTERGAEELTRAMELLRDLARALPAELVGSYLRRSESLELQSAFRLERDGALGATAAPG